ncbi:MAG: CRISPR-associated ring nuclease [Bacillota bacterium]
MARILVCTLGYSPGVVTKMVQHLQENGGVDEVCLVTTNNTKIMDIYNHILRRELNDKLQLQDKHWSKTIPPEDLSEQSHFKEFRRELAAILKERLQDNGENIVHLCISGGRKTMTYAAALAAEEVAACLGETVTRERFHVWHIQLIDEQEPAVEDIEERLQRYRSRRDNEDDRRWLYPENSQVLEIPYFHFAEAHRVRDDSIEYDYSKGIK